MTRTRHIGHRNRRAELRRRQQAFLAELVESSGSRTRAIEASGVPAGTIFRWQASDPWFASQYAEIKEVLLGDAQALRENLLARALAQILGARGGVLGLPALRRIVDALDQREADAAGSAELDAQIEALLGR